MNVALDRQLGGYTGQNDAGQNDAGQGDAGQNDAGRGRAELGRAELAGALRVMTCGSVDDGKSTLIGRILFDANLLLDDQLARLHDDSRRFGSAGDGIDYSLLMDGLAAEREQAITIDVAYRFATTPRRRLIFADAPGHEQYTRNMATAASTADAALLLVDARKGVLTQTRRHAFIASLMGVGHVVLVVNKMDLVDFDEACFRGIVADFMDAAASAKFASVTAIPVSARDGDNVIARSGRMPWFTGAPVLACLENLERGRRLDDRPFRLPVQWVNRPDASFRGYAGTIAAGRVRVGDEVTVSGSHASARVRRIASFAGDAPAASVGDAVTIQLDRELDISRGDIVGGAGQPVEVADQFGAHMVWLAATPLFPGRSYLFKVGTRLVDGSVTSLRHRIDVDTREELAATKLELNDVARVNIALSAPVGFEPYAANRHLGGFIVIDRQTNATVGVGMIEHALKRSSNIGWQDLTIGRAQRAAAKGHSPAVLWFTGLSGAGKSTIANLVEARLHAMGCHTYTLDGDNVRHGLNRDLGFTESDRVENIRRIGEVAALFADAGMIVLVSFISPYRAERDMARALLPAGEFLEVFVDTSIDECRRRDPKGLYEKAVRGEIPNFTGISAPYEPPLAPDIRLDTAAAAAETLADEVVRALKARRFIA